jgi:hypothetical protein
MNKIRAWHLRSLITEDGLLRQVGLNRHRGRGCPRTPATPPDMRVRIRRFGELSRGLNDQSRKSERSEVGIGQRASQGVRVRQMPRAMGASGRHRGTIRSNSPRA